ncbi:Clavaminate synthase-like protein [Xylaria bambusicola]|uniref:Clavaminate synthase-like protein n=1 Tax=Xylaria bambusicola TaxID=326684 RepID=UPI0020074FCF|nr:Clavaminate synthase-like protein [Xylaria bambusicola]KAI0505153.1 Clavaminate synthase-like protein [Xylaria bambusicola]
MTTNICPAISHGLTGLGGWPDHGEQELAMSPSSHGQTPAQPPRGFPPSIQGPAVWSAEDDVLSQPPALELGQAGIAEIEQALKHFLGLGLDGNEVSNENFPLPILGSQLRDCAVNIHRGSGICVVRGLAPEKHSAEDNTIIFLGLASYIGDQRGMQNAKGAMLSHVYESKFWTVPRAKRHGIHTNKGLPFHNDMGCEILAIHIRNCAAQGGQTSVASAAAVYNALMRIQPWAVHVLAEPKWPIQISTRPGAAPFVLGPLLGFQSGNLVMSVDPGRIGPHPAMEAGRIPGLLPAQKLALALVQDTAAAQQIRLPTQQGDMIFINNWSVLHAREPYEDSDSATRHLVRLWLRNSELSWEVPKTMKTPWEASFGTKAKKIVNKQYPVAPMPEYVEPKFSNGSAAFVIESDEGE